MLSNNLISKLMVTCALLAIPLTSFTQMRAFRTKRAPMNYKYLKTPLEIAGCGSSLNENGLVVGGADIRHAWNTYNSESWNVKSNEVLRLDVAPGKFVGAKCVNDFGAIAGWVQDEPDLSVNYSGSQQDVVVLRRPGWTHTVTTPFVRMPATQVTLIPVDGEPVAIDRKAEVVGNTSPFARDHPAKIFMWRDGIVTYLDAPARAEALAMNDKGDIVGTVVTTGGTRAALWTHGTYRDLETPVGATSVAAGINNARTIVGWYISRDKRKHACTWTHRKLRCMRDSPWLESRALAINQRGDIVGDVQVMMPNVDAPPTHLIVWSGRHIWDITQYMSELWDLSEISVAGFNNHRDILVSGGVYGFKRDFLLTPQDDD